MHRNLAEAIHALELAMLCVDEYVDEAEIVGPPPLVLAIRQIGRAMDAVAAVRDDLRGIVADQRNPADPPRRRGSPLPEILSHLRRHDWDEDQAAIDATMRRAVELRGTLRAFTPRATIEPEPAERGQLGQ